MNLIFDRHREPRMRVGRKADLRRDLQHLIRAIERQQARTRGTGNVRQLRQQERRRGAEIRCFRNDGEKLCEPLTRKLGYSR